MKKVLFIMLPLLFVTLLSAVHLTLPEYLGGLDIQWGGDFRTRLILNNNVLTHNGVPVWRDGGWMDNRLQINMRAALNDNFALGWGPEIGYQVFTGFGTVPGFGTRELYLDYTNAAMNSTVRVGRQYWYDHASVVLDDYFAGVTADMKLAGMQAEMGFVKADAGIPRLEDDTNAFFFNIGSETPISLGVTAMYDQEHPYHSNIWLMPYAAVEAGPAKVDATLLLNEQMDSRPHQDDNLGMGLVVKASMDMVAKLNADFMFTSKEGINTLSPYYQNGLIMFGNNYDFDGAQVLHRYDGFGNFGSVYAPYMGNDHSYMHLVLGGSLPLGTDSEVFAHIGGATLKKLLGTEVNAGLNYKVTDKVTLSPVVALGNTGKGLESHTHFVYMLGGLFKAEF